MAINRTAVALAASVTAVVAIGIWGGVAAIANSGGGSAPTHSPLLVPAGASTSTSAATVARSASPAPVVAAKVSRSVKVAAPVKPRRAAVVNQEPTVDNNATTTAAAAPAADPSTDSPLPPGGGRPRGNPGSVVNDPYRSDTPSGSPSA